MLLHATSMEQSTIFLSEVFEQGRAYLLIFAIMFSVSTINACFLFFQLRRSNGKGMILLFALKNLLLFIGMILWCIISVLLIDAAGPVQYELYNETVNRCVIALFVSGGLTLGGMIAAVVRVRKRKSSL